MTKRFGNETGAVILAFALFLVLLLCFVAFGTEAGRWYLVRAELSKAVDAGALAGAKNISNPHVDPRALADEFCDENFPSGGFGTPGAGGAGSVNFNVAQNGSRITIDGHANSPPIMARLLGVGDVPVSSGGAAQMRPVQIMLVLDRSGSMGESGGLPMRKLKEAANSFVDFFQDTQATDKMGLISFSSSVRVDRRPDYNFVTALKTAINNLTTDNWTNAEDAIDQADGPSGLPDQTGVPSDSKVAQFVIFFSDGRPNTWRSTFRYRNADYDAVISCDCDPGNNRTIVHQLWYPDREAQIRTVNGTINPTPTGDGMVPSRYGAARITTRWNIFDTRPLVGYAADAYHIPEATLHDYNCATAYDLAVQHAQEMKDKDITIYTIGLGNQIGAGFLTALASSPAQAYTAYAPADLPAIFQKVAKDIKLRLVM